jgi:O-antigen/teichoic acid export membrane protein
MLAATPDTVRTALGLMLLTAGSLAVVSVLHLANLVGGGGLDRPGAAAIAEAVICVVLLAGARALARGRRRGPAAARASLAFAVSGFIVGLTFTLRGGDAFDVAYHLTGLAVLVVTFVLLGRPLEPR